jgi:hypothetical protein
MLGQGRARRAKCSAPDSICGALQNIAARCTYFARMTRVQCIT